MCATRQMVAMQDLYQATNAQAHACAASVSKAGNRAFAKFMQELRKGFETPDPATQTDPKMRALMVLRMAGVPESDKGWDEEEKPIGDSQ